MGGGEEAPPIITQIFQMMMLERTLFSPVSPKLTSLGAVFALKALFPGDPASAWQWLPRDKNNEVFRDVY